MPENTDPNALSSPVYGAGSIVQRGMAKRESFTLELLEGVIMRVETPKVTKAVKVADAVEYAELMVVALGADPEALSFPVYGGGYILEKGTTKEEAIALRLLKSVITRKETPKQSKSAKLSDALEYKDILIAALGINPSDGAAAVYAGGEILQAGFTKRTSFALRFLEANINRKEAPSVNKAEKVADAIEYADLLIDALNA